MSLAKSSICFAFTKTLINKEKYHTRALIIAPTREIAEQIYQDIKSLGIQSRLHGVTLYGGVGLNPQILKLHIGRTGRAELKGKSYNLVAREDKLILRSIDRMLGSLVECRALADFDYGTSMAPVAYKGPPSRMSGKFRRQRV